MANEDDIVGPMEFLTIGRSQYVTGQNLLLMADPLLSGDANKQRSPIKRKILRGVRLGNLYRDYINAK